MFTANHMIVHTGIYFFQRSSLFFYEKFICNIPRLRIANTVQNDNQYMVAPSRKGSNGA
jgi:hypothetical protein